MCLAQEHNTVTTVRLEPAIPRSQVKYFTTDLLHSHNQGSCETVYCNYSVIFALSSICKSPVDYCLTEDSQTMCSLVCACIVTVYLKIVFCLNEP